VSFVREGKERKLEERLTDGPVLRRNVMPKTSVGQHGTSHNVRHPEKRERERRKRRKKKVGEGREERRE